MSFKYKYVKQNSIKLKSFIMEVMNEYKNQFIAKC